IIATEPIPDFIKKSYPGGEAVADCNHVLDYFRPSPDGRILFGGRALYNGRESKDFMTAIRPRLAKVFPELAKVKLDYGWSGLVAISPHRLPHLGRAGRNFYYATGYSGQGIALANYAGLVLAKAIKGEGDIFAEMEKWPKSKFFGRGKLDPVLRLLGMVWFMLRDLRTQP
ncbi:MAG: FAD-binding oxidoreductase, partial [Alphaproteobacteria bacterium]|nr:FAD-binding oxidoreductase [Alphaproteobacteria bacterium]